MRDVICLMGPTASGKTDLAIRLVEKLPCEIISVDSAMVYQGMDIGTAKPDSELLQQAPHFLIDVQTPVEPYSAADFCKDAQQLCDDILARGHIPLLVGGTMMYFRALQEGLSYLPKADEAIRNKLATMLKARGLLHLYQELEAIDPDSAQKLHPNDTQRILRALEVFYVTGEPMSKLQRQGVATGQAYHWLNIALFPEDRAWLHARIAKRFDMMLEAGFIDEVKGLLQKWPADILNTPAMRSVGYRQAIAYLNGECDFEAFRNQGIAATRQLAKRQLTWLRSWSCVHYLNPLSPTCFDETLELVKTMLDNERNAT